jgi:iron complex transport system permease protein
VRRGFAPLAFAGLALLLVVGLGLGSGAVPIGPREIVVSLLAPLGFDLGEAVGARESAVVQQLRLPRVLAGLGFGAVLGAGGATMQAIFRNPLADPALLGVSLGAALGAALSLVLVDGGASLYVTPLAAFAGGLAATSLTVVAAQRRGSLDTSALLLGGIAVQAFCGAGIGLLTYVATDAQQRGLTFWLLGSLGGSSWAELGAAALPVIVALVALPTLGRSLDALALGQAEAGDLGVSVARVRAAAVALTALGVGAAVASAGPIGFVGLVVPHLVRLLVGGRATMVILASALGGGMLLVAADTIARSVAAPAEIPIGVVTAFIGGPFFYFLLIQKRAPERV